MTNAPACPDGCALGRKPIRLRVFGTTFDLGCRVPLWRCPKCKGLWTRDVLGTHRQEARRPDPYADLRAKGGARG